jgi:hypothetical protein
MGTKEFTAFMRSFHDQFRQKPVTTAAFLDLASKAAGRDIRPLIKPWIERTDLPAVDFSVAPVTGDATGPWKVRVTARQAAQGYPLQASVEFETAKKRIVFPAEIGPGETNLEFSLPEKPLRVLFNSGRDFPVPVENYYQFGSFAEEFRNTWIAYGTSRQVEANRTMAERLQATLADGFSESLPPLVKDSEVSEEGLGKGNVILVGAPSDNSLLTRLPKPLPMEFGTGVFKFRGKTYANAEDGIFLALPNPANPKKFLFVYAGNSPTELFHMTKTYRPGLPSWAVFKGEEVVEQGHFGPEAIPLD